jgi:hypothetical protein
MSSILRPALAALFLLAPGPLLAQEGEGGAYVDHQPVDVNGPVFIPPLSLPPRPAPRTPPPGGSGVDIGPGVAQSLIAINAFCAGIGDATYRVDCLAERMEEVARSIPTDGPYADSRAALLDAAERLRALAAENADPVKGKKTFATAGDDQKQRNSRPITPVASARLAAVQAEAVAILTLTQTVLLRSSETQTASAAQIQQIAAAVGSNKVLLRSA